MMKRKQLPLALALAAGMTGATFAFASDITVLTDPNQQTQTEQTAETPEANLIDDAIDLLEENAANAESESESENESESETETETEDVYVEGSALISDYGYTPGELTEDGWISEFLMMEYVPEEEITMGVDENERLKEYHTRFGEDKQLAANELVALNEEEGFLQLMVEVNPNSESDEDILTRFAENEKLELVSDHSRMEIAGKSFLVCTGIVEKDRYLIGTCTEIRGYVIALKVKYTNTATRKSLMDGLVAYEPIEETESETETGTVETDPVTLQPLVQQTPETQQGTSVTPVTPETTAESNAYLTDPNGNVLSPTPQTQTQTTPQTPSTTAPVQTTPETQASVQQTPATETPATQSQSGGGSVLSGFSLPDSFRDGEVIG